MPATYARPLLRPLVPTVLAVASALLTSCGGGAGSAPGVPPQPSFVQYALSGNMSGAGPITVGSDGALWLIASLAHNGTQGSVWRLTTSGAATLEFTSDPSQILPFGACTTGSDGAVWFFTFGGGMGRITPAGSVRFFPLPAGAYVAAMTVGPDGAVWFTDIGMHALGRITTTGTVTEFPTTLVASSFTGIAAGSDGALWFTSYTSISPPPNSTNDRIGRYSPATGFTSFAVTPGSAPTGIAAGPDGALWYTENGADNIGRLTTAGTLTEFPVGHSTAGSGQNIARVGNALWFVGGGVNTAIGEITTAGAVALTPVPSQYALAGGIAATSDGSLWLSSAAGVVHFTP